MNHVQSASAAGSEWRPKALVAAVLIAIGLMAAYPAWQYLQPVSVRFAIPANQNDDESQQIWPASKGWPGTDALALIWDVYKAEGLDLDPVYTVGGKGALDAVLDGKADLAFASLAAVVERIANGSPLLVLAITTRSQDQIKLIARREAAQHWLEKPIGYSRGTILESALLAQLQALGKLDLLKSKKLALVNFDNPRNVVAALIEGSIQTASVLRPFADFAISQTAPGKPSIFVDVTLPQGYWFENCVVTTQRGWQASRNGILKALTAIKRTRQMARERPARAFETIMKYEAAGVGGMPASPSVWKIEDLVFLTRPADIGPSLIREAELRTTAGLMSKVPDFSNALSLLGRVNEGLGSP